MIASAIVWRIVWKELRQLAPVWAVVLAVSVFVHVSLWQFTEVRTVVGLALAFLTAFGGCLTALMLFAMEHDSQTVRFLQHLPQTRRLVVTTKIIVGLIGTIVLFFLVAGVNSFPSAYRLSRSQPLGYVIQHWYSFKMFLEERVWQEIAFFTSLWGFLLACLTSAVIKRSLPAGSVAIGLLGLLAVASFGSSWWDSQAVNWLFADQGERLTSASRIFNLIGLALLFGASLVVGRSWLDTETADESIGLFQWLRRRKQPGSEFTSNETSVTPKRRAGQRTKLWTVLFWLAMRQSRLSLAIFLIAGIGIAIALQFVSLDAHEYAILYVRFLGPLLALSALSLGAGTEVFWPDQARDAKRFFWQHTLNGRTIWWVRLLPWLALVFVLTVVFAFANQQIFRLITEETILREALNPRSQTTSVFGTLSPEMVTALAAYWRPGSHLLFFGLIALGIGQFFSLLFRNGLVALSCSIIVGPLAIYYVAHVVSTGEQAIWFAAPWGLCWFLASWYLAKSWIDGTLTWRGRTGAIAFLLAAFVTQFSAFAYHRAFEYPKTDWLEQVENETANGDEFFEVASSLDHSMVDQINQKWEGSVGNYYYALPFLQNLEISRLEISETDVQAVIDPNLDRLERLQQIVTGAILLPKKSAITIAAWEKACSKAQSLLRFKARFHLDKAELAKSLECYVSILRIETFNPTAVSSDNYRRTGRSLLRWADHPNQTRQGLEDAEEILATIQPPVLRAYYRARALDRLHREEFGVNRNGWMNLFGQPWEQERRYRLNQLNLRSHHELVRKYNAAQTKAGYPTAQHSVESPASCIRFREFLLTKQGQKLWTDSKMHKFPLDKNREFSNALNSYPLNPWAIFGDLFSTSRGYYASGFERLDNCESERSVTLEYVQLRLLFKKFWLENNRYPTDVEGRRMLMDWQEYSSVTTWSSSLRYFYTTNFYQRLNESDRVTERIPPNQPALVPQLSLFGDRLFGWRFSSNDFLLEPDWAIQWMKWFQVLSYIRRPEDW